MQRNKNEDFSALIKLFEGNASNYTDEECNKIRGKNLKIMKKSVFTFKSIYIFRICVHITVFGTSMFGVCCDTGRVLLLDSGESSGRLLEEL